MALQSLSEVFEYTFEEFGERQMRRLFNQIISAVRRIAVFPASGILEPKCSEAMGVEYRSILVISQIKILYTVNGNTIFVEYVRNARLADETVLERLRGSL